MTAYDRHKLLVNEYLLNYPGATKLLQRDTSKDKNDLDVIKENHRFLWDNVDNSELTWEQQLAKNYYDKVNYKFIMILNIAQLINNIAGNFKYIPLLNISILSMFTAFSRILYL